MGETISYFFAANSLSSALNGFGLDSILEVFSLSKSLSYLQAGFYAGMQLFGQFSMLSVIGYGGYLVLQNAMTVGTLTSFIFYRFVG